MNILDSLKENNSILLKKNVKTWEEAITLLMKPLYENGAITENYSKAIIDRTNEIGPFYVIAPNVAMPHERPECGALKNSFSFLSLENPVMFPGNEEVSVLIGFSAVDKDVHLEVAIPQIVSLLEKDDFIDRIKNIDNEEDFSKYILEILN